MSLEKIKIRLGKNRSPKENPPTPRKQFFVNSAEIIQGIINVLTFWVLSSLPCLVSAEEVFFLGGPTTEAYSVTHCGVNFLGTRSSLISNFG